MNRYNRNWLILCLALFVLVLLSLRWIRAASGISKAAEIFIMDPDQVLLDWQKEFPAHLPFRATRTSVVVGPFVILTAAHVVKHESEYRVAGYLVRCWRHPEYGTQPEKNPSADIALCLVLDDDEIVQGEPYETIYETIDRPVELPDEVLLTGLGTRDKRGRKGLGIKKATTTARPTNNGYFFLVDACLQGGDSGGPVFDIKTKRIIGVNSQHHCTENSNYSAVTSTGVKDVAEWFDFWIKEREKVLKDKEKAKICGVNLFPESDPRCRS